ncbi:MAG TPA: ornithine cyclodeaminase family protein [Ktedonobacterales bacterium]
MELLTLSAREVERLLDPDALLDALAAAFKALNAGQIDAPKRIAVVAPGAGSLLAMPAYRQDHDIAVKLVSVYPDNERRGLPTHQALILLFDPATGSPLAVMDGGVITALRTAGAAALSARLLAREQARTLAIVGAGVQGRAHLTMLPHARPFTDIRIVSRDPAHAARLAANDPRARAVASVKQAVDGADVVCLCTNSATPVINSDWLVSGAHLTSVGWAPPGGELDPETLEWGSLYVETLQAFEPPPVGCAELDGLDPSAGTEIGALVSGLDHGRRSEDELTIYKAMGHACEDLAAASLVYQRAKSEGAGQPTTL